MARFAWNARVALVPNRAPRWKTSSARPLLLAIYARVDALLAPFSCDASAECCHFGLTGREPYVTPIELAEIELALTRRGSALARLPTVPRRLPVVADARRCPLLDENGRCSVYASRPLGCRTFFCDRVQGPRTPSARRDQLQRPVRGRSPPPAICPATPTPARSRARFNRYAERPPRTAHPCLSSSKRRFDGTTALAPRLTPVKGEGSLAHPRRFGARRLGPA